MKKLPLFCRHNAPTFNATDKNKRPWIVFVACGLNIFISGGIFMGINAVYLDILETFQAPRPLAALVPSLYAGIGFAAGKMYIIEGGNLYFIINNLLKYFIA